MSTDEGRIKGAPGHACQYSKWKADGVSAAYSVTCSCGWYSEPGRLGYGYPASEESLFAEHLASVGSP